MTTKAEAKQLAAERLKLVAVGQSVPSEYDTRLDGAYTEVYDYLELRGVATWAADGSMPFYVTPWFVELMALSKMGTLGASQATKAEIIGKVGLDGEEGFKAIRRRVRPDYTSQTDVEDF